MNLVKNLIKSGSQFKKILLSGQQISIARILAYEYDLFIVVPTINILEIFIFVFIYGYRCVCVWECVPVSVCNSGCQKRTLSLEVQEVVSHLSQMFGAKLGFSTKAGSVF